MFRIFGQLATRSWPLLLIGWIVAVVVIETMAPQWEKVIQDGEFRYIPEGFPSRTGENVFKKSFSHDLLGSSVVIVLRREGHPQKLLPKDREFIRKVLRPRLEKIQSETVPLITRIRTLDDPAIGELLVSEDGQATLVILELRTEFLEARNKQVLDRVADLISRDGELRNEKDVEQRIPIGLDISVSGTAAVGRDMRQASEHSANATESATLVLVVVLLLLIYRAPLLVLIPVLTVALSVTIALDMLAFMASRGWIELFDGVRIYVQVVMYGAGVDYCMFLMARYKEELDAGASFDDAIDTAVRKVGPALAASAGTTMAGIGMMVFAQFGKFQQAGVAMSFSLMFVLLAALTFAPALLRCFGRWAFWPQVRSEHIPRTGGWISATSLIHRLMQSGLFRKFWEKIARQLRERPATIWLTSVALMAPFAVIAVINHDNLSFGLLSELPATDPSVVGTDAVKKHFPAGATGPVTILLKSRDLKFRDDDGKSSDEKGVAAIRTLTERLQARKKELGIYDIRSLTQPLGISPAAKRAREKWDANLAGLGTLEIMTRNRRKRQGELDYYVSDKGADAGYVTRIDIVFKDDPFSRDMIAKLDKTEETVRELLPANLKSGTELYFIGSTASIRDLKSVTNSDQVRIYLLVTLGVYVVLIMLLRRPAISAYLIISVLFSYLVTLGVTFTVFWMLDPAGFSGLDWKVPIFLFTILIAVGEDYNIYLITRIDEEQAEHGPLEGIIQALMKTGGIISGCGIIMAGTFSSLMVGSLTGMHQLGFALAFGVLLDTFVIRPILVPAYLMLLYSGRFGPFGRFLGAGNHFPSSGPSWKIGSDTPQDGMTNVESQMTKE